jgi:hypothetical protein
VIAVVVVWLRHGPAIDVVGAGLSGSPGARYGVVTPLRGPSRTQNTAFSARGLLLPQPRVGRPEQSRFGVTDDMNRYLAKEGPKATFSLERLAESTILQGREDAR